MKARTTHLFAAIAGLALAAAGVSLTLRARPRTAPAPAEPAPMLTVESTVAIEQPWPRTLRAVGSIAAWQEVAVGAEIGGLRLSRLLVDVGDRIGRGQLLAQLDPGTLQADLDASRAALREAEVAAAEARRNADRARALAGSGVLSRQVIDQAVSAADAAQARLAAARARMQADALRLARTRVLAPDDGLVSARIAVEGTFVQAGSEIVRLQRQGRLEWRAELPGADLVHVVPGLPVLVTAGDAQPIEGRVRRVSPQVDPEKRTGLVFVDLEPSAHARAGLFARGDFLLDRRTVLTVPESAVLLRDGFSYVFRIERDRVREQKVELGARRDGRVEIRAGLVPGAVVAHAGVAFLADGVAVRVADAATR